MINSTSQSFQYPFVPYTRSPWPLSLRRNLASLFDYYFKRLDTQRKNSFQLNLVSGQSPRPLTNDDMPLVFLTHNDIRYLKSFLQHYRNIGVTRFICIDDVSSDGSLEYLLKQEDVDLYTSNVRFTQSARGKAWREKLFEIYGYDRWYINVDSDEYLIFESIDSESIRSYCKRLKENSVYRLPAVMLDMYPLGDLSKASFNSNSNEKPWDIATHFDGNGYFGNLRCKGIELYGGIRHRLFHIKAELIKYPLVYWTQKSSMSGSIHFPLPTRYSFPNTMSCLLHFKIFSDLDNQIQQTIDNGQHFQGSKYYREWQDQISTEGLPNFEYENSVKFRNAQDLMDRGFILPLCA